MIIMALSILAFEKIAKKSGVKRISRSAVEELRDIAEEYGAELAQRACQVSKHSGKRTVQKRDIEFVSGK